jgi:hypothetical protein
VFRKHLKKIVRFGSSSFLIGCREFVMKEKAGFVKHVLELMAPLVEDARRAVRRTANRKKPKYYREESS